jgi:hypothetical protein
MASSTIAVPIHFTSKSYSEGVAGSPSPLFVFLFLLFFLVARRGRASPTPGQGDLVVSAVDAWHSAENEPEDQPSSGA